MNFRARFVLILAMFLPALNATANDIGSVQLGPRPFYLVDEMTPGRLQRELQACAEDTRRYRAQDWSIGHRGAPLQFPEHTRESYVASARMGAGILECDVTFTQDLELVCRHAQCDLHTTTNIVATPLASKCSVPPAFDAAGNLINAADIRCCTSDITLDEFRTLEGKMDAADRSATTIDGYLGGTADFRTDLYTTGGTLMTHAESIALFQELGVGMTPELKSPAVTMPFNGFTQEDYAQALINEYRAAGVPPRDVWPQSFNYNDVLFWVRYNADYGQQAVYLISDSPTATGPIAGPPPDLVMDPPRLREFKDVWQDGVNIIAPPMPALVTVNRNNRIVPSRYARRAARAGLEMISWTTERSGRIVEDVRDGPDSNFYYRTTVAALENDGNILETLDVLAQRVGIIGLFSDWPATTTFYANCKDTPRFGDRGHRHHDDDDWDEND